MTVGNGGDHKARRFSVELKGGRTIVYDGTREHPHKLVDGGVPVAMDAPGPLDVVLMDFMAKAEVRREALAMRTTHAMLQLSARVNGILDDSAARAIGTA